MMDLAVEFSYYLVNPNAPWLVEGQKAATFYDLEDVVRAIGDAGLAHLITGNDVGAAWDSQLEGRTENGVTFKKFIVEGGDWVYLAYKQ